MMYILILTIMTHNSVSVATAEFNTKDLCEAAGKLWKAKNSKYSESINYQCSPKGYLVNEY